MIDWAAVAAIAAVGAVVVGYMQVRVTRMKPNVVQQENASSPPPLLFYSVQTGSGSYQFPQNWRVEIEHANWAVQAMMQTDLQNFSFAIVALKNPNSYAIQRVCLDLAVSRIWSASVTSTDNLSKKSVAIRVGGDGMRTDIEELPAGESIKIAVCGGYISNVIESANAAVTLKRMDFHYG